jgi:hypothetical protein
VSLPKDIFDVIGHTQMFSTLDLQYEYHQLPFHEGDKANITFWGIDQNGMDSLYNWKFLPFGLKNAF